MSEPTPDPEAFGDGPAGRDLAVIVGVSIVVIGLLLLFDVIGRAGDQLERLGRDVNLDPLVALLIVTPLAATTYSLRRYHDARAAHEALMRRASVDPLTGLNNRSVLVPSIKRMVKVSHRRAGRAGVAVIDLDRFKAVNDTYGHRIGDRLMVAVIHRLQTVAPPEVELIRRGEDEFIALLPDLASEVTAERIIRNLLESLEEPFTIGTDRLRTSASAGLALSSSAEADPEDLLEGADLAMRQSKAAGGGRVTVHDGSNQRRILTPRSAEARLSQALDRNEFGLAYQPVVSLADGRVVGAEALLRWYHPERGEVGPVEFVPILEETGLIVEVGRRIFEATALQASQWRNLLPDGRPLRLTVNVSARQLAQVDFQEVVAEAVRTSGLGAGQLCLEVTEGALMADVSTAWTVLRHAKNLGLGVALDDFGTGYSSLSYVRRFSLDMLKIDRSFVSGLGTSPEDRAIVAHVIGMAKALGMVVVAEGVEEPEQLRELINLGCDLAQGWIFSRAVPPDQFEAVVRDHDRFGVLVADARAELAPSGLPVLGAMPLKGAAGPRSREAATEEPEVIVLAPGPDEPVTSALPPSGSRTTEQDEDDEDRGSDAGRVGARPIRVDSLPPPLPRHP